MEKLPIFYDMGNKMSCWHLISCQARRFPLSQLNKNFSSTHCKQGSPAVYRKATEAKAASPLVKPIQKKPEAAGGRGTGGNHPESCAPWV